ncbi:hypothetical protein WBJ53_20975 [Spirosoma sp. SC4-14]|uniref:hypothetical protein n=1 Tax=Spirosoma sp. SC4-14 TaxID=3128900 RepID=UPI0030D44D03
MVSAPSQANLKDKTPPIHLSWYAILSIPVLIHVWIVYRFTVNIPYIDDYTFLLDCLSWKQGGFPLSEYLRRLFFPHGEHIIFFARLAVFVDYWLEGTLHFRTLFFVGNLTFLGTAWLLFRQARRGGLQPIQFLPVVFILFQPQSYENTLTWAICALQHMPALFFAFWSFDLLSRSSTKAFFASFPLAFLGIFSNGNGLAILAVGFLLLLALNNRRRLIMWGLFAVVSLGIYVYIHHASHSPEVGSNLMHPVRILAGFFLMVGSMGLLFTQSTIILSLIGIGISLCTAVILGLGVLQYTQLTRILSRFPVRFRHWLDQNRPESMAGSPFLVLTACCLYALITLLGVAVARSTGWYQGLLLPRYVWFTNIAFAVIYLLLLLSLSTSYRTRVSRIFLGLAVLFNVFSYRLNLGEVMAVRQSLLSDTHDWRETGMLVSLPPNTREHDHFYSEVLQTAIQKGVYRLPESPIHTISSQVVSASGFIAKDSTFTLGDRQIHSLTIDSTLPALALFDAHQYYLQLTSNEHTFIWPINRTVNKLAQSLITGKTDWANNLVWIYEDQLPPATYKPALVWSDGNQWHQVTSEQVLAISSINHYQ